MLNAEIPPTSATLLGQLVDPLHREEAWRVFFSRYQPVIYDWCRRSLQPADADDVVAAVLCKLVAAMSRFHYDPQRRFRSWLGRVVHNALVDHWKELAAQPGGRGCGDDAAQVRLVNLPAADDIVEISDTLARYFETDLQKIERIKVEVQKQVEPQTWHAFLMTEMEGKKPRDVARQLGMTVASVYKARTRVGRRLADEWKRHFPLE